MAVRQFLIRYVQKLALQFLGRSQAVPTHNAQFSKFSKLANGANDARHQQIARHQPTSIISVISEGEKRKLEYAVISDKFRQREFVWRRGRTVAVTKLYARSLCKNKNFSKSTDPR
jgi:hypothetical protein